MICEILLEPISNLLSRIALKAWNKGRVEFERAEGRGKEISKNSV